MLVLAPVLLSGFKKRHCSYQMLTAFNLVTLNTNGNAPCILESNQYQNSLKSSCIVRSHDNVSVVLHTKSSAGSGAADSMAHKLEIPFVQISSASLMF